MKNGPSRKDLTCTVLGMTEKKDQKCSKGLIDGEDELNYMFTICHLGLTQYHFNGVLEARGFVFLSEILEYLNLEVPPYAKVVGWHEDINDDNGIVFGKTSAVYPTVFDLNFNCDGCIINYIC